MSDRVNISEKIEENGQYYIEISSEKFLEFDYILIKNYYVSSISFKIFHSLIWVSILEDYALMPRDDLDEDCEKYFLISKKDLKISEKGFNENEINKIRIYMNQPNKIYLRFNLPYIKLINSTDPDFLCTLNMFKFEANPNKKIVIDDRNVNIIIDKDEIARVYTELSSKANSITSIQFS